MRFAPHRNRLILTSTLTNLHRRAFFALGEESNDQLLVSQLHGEISQQLRVDRPAQPVEISEMARAARQLMSLTVSSAKDNCKTSVALEVQTKDLRQQLAGHEEV